MEAPGTVLTPIGYEKATLVDLLDRVFDKGVVVHADLLICVAGVPLLGVNLRAALAGMETMRRYGIMQDWDARVRESERSAAALPAPQPLAVGSR
ncbi:MAG: gas vesicle protein [Dehalococcoidia bacterium]